MVELGGITKMEAIQYGLNITLLNIIIINYYKFVDNILHD